MDFSIRPAPALAPTTTDIYLSPDNHTVHAIERNIKGKRWNERAIDAIKVWDEELEKAIPNNRVQKVLDDFGAFINKLLTPATNFSSWLDHNNYNTWYKQFASYVGKLPLKAVRNIIRIVYNIVKGTIYTFVHPFKAILNVPKFIIQFIDSLTKPETYTKMGASVIGASLGHAAVSAGFGLHAYIALGVGGALLIGGLTSGAIMAFATAEKGEGIKDTAFELWKQAKMVPEFLLTGFLMGVIITGVSKVVFKDAMVYKTKTVTDTDAANKFVQHDFLPKYNLPPPSSVTVDPSGQISIVWQGNNLSQLAGNPYYAQMFGDKLTYLTPNTFRIDLLPHSYSMTPIGMDPTNIVNTITGDNFLSKVVSYDVGTHYPTAPIVSQVTTATQVAAPQANSVLIGLTATEGGK